MNPIFSGDSNRPAFAPGGSPTIFGQGGYQPAQSQGGGGGQGSAPVGSMMPGPLFAATQTTNGAPQYVNAGASSGRRPTYGTEGRGGPALDMNRGAWAPPAQYAKYYGGGNIGNSQPGATGRYNPVPTDNNSDYPWMQDQSIQWGGGPHGYLPIDYRPQTYDYYSQGNYGSRLAPWEYKYMKDTWTQNFDRNEPGFINTERPGFGSQRG